MAVLGVSNWDDSAANVAGVVLCNPHFPLAVLGGMLGVDWLACLQTNANGLGPALEVLRALVWSVLDG